MDWQPVLNRVCSRQLYPEQEHPHPAEYMRYCFKTVSCCKSSKKNRYQNVFTVCNVALDAVVSVSSITDYIVNFDSENPFSLQHSHHVPLLGSQPMFLPSNKLPFPARHSVMLKQEFRCLPLLIVGYVSWRHP